MMDAISQSLGAATGLEYPVAEQPKIEDITDQMRAVVRKNNGEDYQFVRQNLRAAIDQAVGMLPGLVGLAKVAESPNLYNSAAGFLDSFMKLNQALLDNGVKAEKIAAGAATAKVPAKVDAQGSPQSQQGDEPGEPKGSGGDIVFEGTTDQFLEMLLKARAPKPVEVIEVPAKAV